MAPSTKSKGLAALPTPGNMDAFVAGGTPTPAAAAKPAAAAEPPKGGDSLPPSLQAAPIEAEEPTQRLTLEIPLSLHILIKTGTVQRRTKMKDEVLALLEAHYRPKA